MNSKECEKKWSPLLHAVSLNLPLYSEENTVNIKVLYVAVKIRHLPVYKSEELYLSLIGRSVEVFCEGVN
jgi:hypothetical protein